MSHLRSRRSSLGCVLRGKDARFPPSSPDLNPIEGVWRTLKMCVCQNSPVPRTEAELRQGLKEEWD